MSFSTNNYHQELVKAISNAQRLWIEWQHISISLLHCPICLKLDRFWFAGDNKPTLPQHPHCHCVVKRISYYSVKQQARARAPFSKFDPYLFNREQKYTHDKQKLFQLWGYTIEDSKWLQEETERQGLAKYLAGDYTLGKLSENGQHLSIRVEIERRDNGAPASYITGWMVHPNGEIRLITPYGGK